MTSPKRLSFGKIYAHHLTLPAALEHVDALIESGSGGFVVTPNVDHVVLAENDSELVEVYEQASLSLVDGMPLLWLSHAMGAALPEKISGSDFVGPLMQRAAQRGHRVFLLGAKPGVGKRAAQHLQSRYPKLAIVGTSSPPLGFEQDPSQTEKVLQEVRQTKPHIVLMALGCPKQEKLMARYKEALAPAVMFGIGATLDFLAGEVRRAPPWMSTIGAEWLFRLTQDPKRLAHRYLVRDRAIIGIAIRSWRQQRRKHRNSAACH